MDCLEEKKQWRSEFEKLRVTVLQFSLTEELKWGHTCYIFQDKNLVLIHGFKNTAPSYFSKACMAIGQASTPMRHTTSTSKRVVLDDTNLFAAKADGYSVRSAVLKHANSDVHGRDQPAAS